VTVAETRLPSGVAALLVATVPLWMIVFAWPVQRQRVTARSAAGLAIGLGGVAILVGAGLSGHGMSGVFIVLGASAAWGFGSVLSHRLPVPGNALLAAAIEMLAGGVALLAVAAAVFTYAYVNPVVAVLAGIVFLDEQFSWRKGLGAALVLASVVIILNRPRSGDALPGTVRQRTAAQSAISGGTAP
jgi:drug/metabolite transporter (DMT)-like permease